MTCNVGAGGAGVSTAMSMLPAALRFNLRSTSAEPSRQRRIKAPVRSSPNQFESLGRHIGRTETETSIHDREGLSDPTIGHITDHADRAQHLCPHFWNSELGADPDLVADVEPAIVFVRHCPAPNSCGLLTLSFSRERSVNRRNRLAFTSLIEGSRCILDTQTVLASRSGPAMPIPELRNPYLMATEAALRHPVSRVW